ncbi:MAG TPA: GNAT family N-acetyltransferase [Cyclobacteriaceae bacterium]|jgi:GNAT superfamily N-acetyltransferase
MGIKIREGKKEDLPKTLELVKELAAYEKALDEVENTVEMMERDGFGDNPVFGMYVAERVNQIIGVAIYYFRYSTWKGKKLYLEDMVITEEERGKGVGKLLFERVVKKAQEEQCTGMSWQVLDWNGPAIKFYEKYNATFDGQWLNCNFDRKQLANFKPD